MFARNLYRYILESHIAIAQNRYGSIHVQHCTHKCNCDDRSHTIWTVSLTHHMNSLIDIHTILILHRSRKQKSHRVNEPLLPWLNDLWPPVANLKGHAPQDLFTKPNYRQLLSHLFHGLTVMECVCYKYSCILIAINSSISMNRMLHGLL